MNPKAAVALAMVAGSSAFGQSFIGLGFLPGDSFSKATAISSDGLSVAGDGPHNTFGDSRACWRWQSGTGLVDLGASSINVTSISSDGSTIVGLHLNSPGVAPAFRWTQATGVQIIPGVYRSTTPSPGVSGDGQVVVGSANSGGPGAVRWTASTGAVLLPDPPLGPFIDAGNYSAMATNFDGSVVVGGAGVQPLNSDSFVVPSRWTAAGGMQLLTLSGGGYVHAGALGVSADGDTIIAATAQVYRWQAATDFVAIPGLSVNAGLGVPALSGDGNTIVSLDKIWSVSAGVQPLTTVLSDAGCDFSGWSALIATGINLDGRTLCGYGTDAAGLTEGWYATVPAPASGLVLLPGLLALRRRR